jgi:hypothetical protein
MLRQALLCASLLSIAFFVPLSSPTLASGPTGSITGSITDSSGAVVARAQITIQNEDTNATRNAESNGDGDYTVALLPPGRYRVSVDSKGFRRSVIRGVGLNVDQTVRVDFALQVGASTEEVSVNEVPPIVQTDTSTLGQLLNNRLVQDLPLNERNFLSFALLVPGSQLPAAGSQNSTQGGALSVNGAREQSNNFLLDGVDNDDPYINQYVALPSIDAIQEFKVQSSDYSAEFGRASGAQINVVLKSGANQFHGSGFEFFRNRNMDAKNYFDFPGEIPALDRNQFGGTFGGPIRRDKTFFFVSYEGLRLRQANTRQATVPSLTQWQYAEGLAQQLFGCPQNPSCQIGQNVFNLYPAPNVGDPTSSNLFRSAPIIRNSENLVTAKVDEQATHGDTISAHYSLIDENLFNPFDPVNAFTALPGYGTFTHNHGQSAGLEWTRVLRSSIVNEVRLGFTRVRYGVFQQNHGNDIATQLGFPNVLTNPVDLGYPNINVTSFDGIGEPINYPQDRHDTTLQLSDNVAWTVGRNQFKIGVDLRHIRIDNYLDFLARGDWFFLGQTAAGILGAFGDPTPCSGAPPDDPLTCSLSQLLGAVPDYALAVSGDTFNSLRSHGVSVYIQDDIHVIPRFLLNVGLRYEFNSPPVEAKNRFSVPDLIPCPAPCVGVQPTFSVVGTNGIPRATYHPTYRDIAPRIGFAWRPLKSERWVVRSAYGIFYDVPIANINILPRINPPFYNLALYPQNPAGCGGLCVVPNILSQAGGGQQAGVVQGNMISPNFRDGYVQQWNADLQYEVLPNWMVDVAYVGSKGAHLSDVLDRNQADPNTGPPYGQFSSILYVESKAASSYNSLQLRSEKRMSRGLALLLSYTYSKSIDDISSIFGGNVGSGLPQNSRDLSADRGPSDFNATHRFSGSFVYDLPFRRLWKDGPGWSERVLNNWQATGIVTAQSGSPFTIVLAGAPAASAAAFGNPARPDLVGNPFQPGSAGCPSQVRVPQSWFNTCAFALPPAGAYPNTYQFGTEGRNMLTGPGFTNIDFALSKSLPLLGESHRLQFRGEFFNLLNHPNFDIPNHVFSSPTFGQVLSANSYGNKPPRQIQLGVKYIF